MTILDPLHAPRPFGLSAMLLVLLVIALVTLAHASPSDQTWLEGVYDQAYFHDVVGLLTSSLEATGSPAAPELVVLGFAKATSDAQPFSSSSS